MKVTVFTASTCPFSQQEKEFLAGNNLAYTELSVDLQSENLAKMLDESEGFSAVPFTVIEKEEGKKEKVKGFDKAKLCLLLDIKEEEKQKTQDAGIEENQPAEPAGESFNILGDVGKNQTGPALAPTTDEPSAANSAPAEAPLPSSSFEPAESQGAEGSPVDSADNLPGQDLKPAQSIDQPFGVSAENDPLDLNAKPPRYEVQEVNPLADASTVN